MFRDDISTFIVMAKQELPALKDFILLFEDEVNQLTEADINKFHLREKKLQDLIHEICWRSISINIEYTANFIREVVTLFRVTLLPEKVLH
ncbi:MULTISPECIES: hypothetical protein [Vibrio]|uniref:Uncharacterized protein n=2 Tax=Vibrio TaxID=662 RepID=A0A7X4LM77_9VIBR|nr:MULTISPECIES: hypothetical protein [Vibrio]MBF9002204.1 hypothetical protein [Vibrio nitrifigilis]MZI94126.1 hypothetical protein [Vibrio eleionomae]